MNIKILPVVLMCAVASSGETASFIRLSPGTYANATAISADGTVVVGNTQSDAFRWSASTGLLSLGAGFTSVATGVSADGSLVVGNDPQFADGYRFFRWTSAGGREYLGRGEARGISANGTTIVGVQFNKAFRWTGTEGLVQLIPSASSSVAYAVFADGGVICG